MVVFMLQISTLILQESCRLSLKNLGFRANLSLSTEKRKFQGKTYKFFNYYAHYCRESKTAPYKYSGTLNTPLSQSILDIVALLSNEVTLLEVMVNTLNK